MNAQQDLSFFETKAIEVGRSPIEEHLKSIVRDGLTYKQHSDDATLRRTEREEGTPEAYISYRSGDEMIPFVQLCRENPQKAMWLINNAQAKARGLTNIAAEQTKILVKTLTSK